MDARVVTLCYQESVQGFAEEAVTRATAMGGAFVAVANDATGPSRHRRSPNSLRG
jgi:hypothetical protein